MATQSEKNFEKFVSETLPLLKQVAEKEKTPLIDNPVNDSSDIAFSGYNKTKLMLSAMANGFEDNRWITEKQLGEKYPDLSIAVPLYIYNVKLLKARSIWRLTRN